MRLILLLCLCVELVLPAWAADSNTNGYSPTSLPPAKPLTPGPDDGKIAYTAAKMLKDCHYLHLNFDAALSSRFLDTYVNTFDPQHIHFLQADIDEFNQYRTNLDVMTKENRDTRPAYLVFNRFMQRLGERSIYSKALLQSEPFEFNGKERVSTSRKTAPFPKDITEAHALWRERLRLEYLDEKLNREMPRTLGTLVTSKHGPVALALTPDDFRRDIVKVIDTRYNRIWRNFRDWESDKVLETYLTALARLYDPHSDYEDHDTLENFSIMMSLSLYGIGALLEQDDDGYCRIKSLTAGAPAARSKLIKSGDRIVAVAQGTNEPVDVIQMPLTKVVDLIRGPKGTEVRVTIVPADSTSTRSTVSITREEIKLEDQAAKAKLIEMTDNTGRTNRLGVIDLPSFYASFSVIGSRSRPEIKRATADVDRLLTKLEENKVDGVILDLRHNGGGSLPEAIDLTGLFIKQGPVVQIKSSDPNAPVQVDEDSDPRCQYDGPLVVLTSRFSASASEIVAGALQDYGRAVVVGGTSTHGKGTVQSMSQLATYLYLSGDIFTNNPASLGALKFTTNKFYRVSGSSTQLKGVIPDIVLPSSYDYMETEEAREENAMPWDEITSADYDKLNRVHPYIAELEKRSTKRVAASKDFAYVREDIDLVKKAMGDKSVSMNEHDRLKEGDEAEARKKTREAEMKARKEPEFKVYDLTIKKGEVVMAEVKKSSTNAPLASAGSKSAEKEKPQAPSGAAPATGEDTSDDTTAAATETEPANPEEKAPLEEAERILMDYISLLRSGPSLTADHQQASSTP